jgi:hypothetical protein
MMIATIRTRLPISAVHAWRVLLKCKTFLHITRGLLGFTGSDKWPAEFHEGALIETRLLFFGLLPAWRHRLLVVSVDHERRELLSRESGGPVRGWTHRIAIEPDGENTCRYTDEISIEAGVLTPLVWAYAHLFYRYRQMRWRALAAGLPRAPQPAPPLR